MFWQRFLIAWIMKFYWQKLHFCEIWGVYEDWSRPYLADRRQKVELKSSNRAPNFFYLTGCALKHGIPQGWILGPPLFIIYINDLPLRTNSVSEPVLFADDTSVITSSKNFEDFCSLSSVVLSHMIKWFVLNLDKMNIMKFITKNSVHSTLNICYKKVYRKKSEYTI